VISHKYKFAFLHLPKCAGSSTVNSFGKCWDDESSLGGHPKLRTTDTHYILCYLDGRRFDLDMTEYKLFTFVRNPFARVVSAFFYLRNSKLRYRIDRRFRDELGLRKMDFNQFVKEKLLITNYMHFVEIIDGYIMNDDVSKFDFIGKTENMQKDLDVLCDLVELPKRILPHINKVPHKHYTEYYDDETKSIVAEKYAKDIEYFGYEFEK
jgi:chondroitin 4-sulfotransferase 11